MSETSLTESIKAFIGNRAETRLEKVDKEAEKKRKSLASDPAALVELERELAQKRADEEARYVPSVWLTNAANRAKQITMVTHAIKYTHGDAKGSSVFAEQESVGSPRYLTTASLKEFVTDVVGNAAALDVAALLSLEANGETLVNQIAQGNPSALMPLAENDEQLADWMTGFKAALADRELSSHTLAKQIYFPVGDGSYHLLGPLYASSLSQALHNRLIENRFSEEAKAARKARREAKFSATLAVDYPGAAVQGFGGANSQNVSQLNSKRGGKSFLLRASPPNWATQNRPPIAKGAFWREYGRRTRGTLSQLTRFLTSVADKNNVRIREHRSDLVDDLVDQLMQYAAEVQGLREQAGWSAETALPRAEQLWLDPYRPDPEFKKEREAGDWQDEIASTFGRWLNGRMRKGGLDVKDAEFIEWKDVLEKKLARLKTDLEVVA